MSRHTFHTCELASHIVLYPLEILRIITPRHNVEVGTDGGQSVGMCLVQVLVNPLLVDAVASAVLGQRLHVPCGFLKLLQILLTVVNQHILVVYVVAGQQQSNGACE